VFSIGGLAGPRLVRIEGIPSGWAVKAIIHAGRDVSETPIVFDDGVVADVQIVLTRALGHVAGGIEPPSGADYAVIVVPEDLTRLADFARFARLVRADQNGRYEVRDLLPGRYVAVAVEDVDESEWSNPDYVRRVRGTGTPVAVSANQTTTLTLELQQP
jgi:hypothetical protein